MLDSPMDSDNSHAMEKLFQSQGKMDPRATPSPGEKRTFGQRLKSQKTLNPRTTAIWVITPGGLIHGKSLLEGLPGSHLFISSTLADAWSVSDILGGWRRRQNQKQDRESDHERNGGEDREQDGELDYEGNEVQNGEQDGETPRFTLFDKLGRALTAEFTHFSAHICIFSTGIAVRLLAPMIQSKLKDPAVVVMDDCAHHAISLISGHLGGANELASVVSAITGADPVITTATDVNGLPSIDMIAKQAHLTIENPEMIKSVNMAFLQKRKIGIIDPDEIITSQIPMQFRTSLKIVQPNTSSLFMDKGIESDPTVWVCCSERITLVPRETLILRPPVLVAGMGCNRNTSMDELMNFLLTTLKEEHLSIHSLTAIATTTVKADEAGLLEMAKTLNKIILFYEKDELNLVETIQNPSKMVEKHLGVKSVCEAAAILATQNGELILPKIKKGNATLAVAKPWGNSLLSVPGREV